MKAFLQKYSGLTHALGALWLTLVAAYSDPLSAAFRNAVNTEGLAIYHSLPAAMAKVLGSLVALALPLWAFYRNGEKQPADSGGAEVPQSRGGALPLVVLGLLLLSSLTARAQSNVANLYMLGGSYSAGSTPSVAGSFLQAHQLTDSGMYEFAMFDALPATKKPFTVTTNVGAGIGQRVATLGTAQIFVPTSAGISFTGTNTGWSWSTGGAAVFPLKKAGWFLMPNIRVLKSSVSGGTGYQPIFGVLVGWGK